MDTETTETQTEQTTNNDNVTGEKTGKNEYILTQDDVESYSPSDIKKSFRDFGTDDGELDKFQTIR